MPIDPESKLFHLALITPEALVLEAEVAQVVFPAHDGSVGILTHRAPLLTKLGAGALRLDAPAGAQKFFVSGGYAQMKDNVLTILTDQVIPPDQITRQMIDAEAARAAALAPADPATPAKRQAIQHRVAALRQLAGA